MKCGGTKELLKWDENGAVESTRARDPCLVVEYLAELQHDT